MAGLSGEGASWQMGVRGEPRTTTGVYRDGEGKLAARGGQGTGRWLGVEARAALFASAPEADEVGGVRSWALAGRRGLSECLLG